jgi:hypothetical protein
MNWYSQRIHLIKRTFGKTKTTFVIKFRQEHIISYPVARILMFFRFPMSLPLLCVIKYAPHIKVVHKYLDANILLK